MGVWLRTTGSMFAKAPTCAGFDGFKVKAGVGSWQMTASPCARP